MLEVHCKSLHLPIGDIAQDHWSTNELRAVVYDTELEATTGKTILHAKVATAATTYHARIAEIMKGDRRLTYTLPPELTYSRAMSLGLQTTKATEIFSLAHSADDELLDEIDRTNELLRMLGAGIWAALQSEMRVQASLMSNSQATTRDTRQYNDILVASDSTLYTTYRQLVSNGQVRLHEDFVPYVVNY